MKTRTFVKHLALLGSVLIGAALQSFAQPAQGGFGGGAAVGAGGGGGFARFEFTEEQQAKMREARQATQAERSQLAEKMTAAQREAVEAALADKPDEKVVRAKLDAVAKIQAEMAALNFKNYQGIKFTAEQREQLTARGPMGYMVLFGGMGGAMSGGMGGGVRRGGPGGGGAGAGGGGGGAGGPVNR